MYSIQATNQFKRDTKLCVKRGLNIELLSQVIEFLEQSGKLSAAFKPHILKGNYKGLWECHIKPDWLLIWEQDELEKLITLHRTGTHSDLFKK